MKKKVNLAAQRRNARIGGIVKRLATPHVFPHRDDGPRARAVRSRISRTMLVEARYLDWLDAREIKQ
jgi:hypothetical protein